MATSGRAGPEIGTLPAAAGQRRLAAPSSCQGFESRAVSSSDWFLLIHAPSVRPPRCPHILCQFSNPAGLFSIPAGQEAADRRWTECHGQTLGVEICCLRPQPKQD